MSFHDSDRALLGQQLNITTAFSLHFIGEGDHKFNSHREKLSNAPKSEAPV